MSRKQIFIDFIPLALLVIALRLPSLNLPLDNDSSAVAFFARQMMRGETLYDKFHTGHHLPGIYYTFLFAFTLFGDNPAAPKLLLIPVVIMSVWLIFLMGRAFFNRRTGMLAAVFYALVSSQTWFAGDTAQMEHFANLPLIAAMFLFLNLLRKNAPAVQFIWVGVLGAICILYKIVFVGSLAAVGLSILIGAWLEKDQAGNGKKLLLRLGSMTVGFILPLALVGGYFASMGLWQRLTLVFTLGFDYFNDAGMLAGGMVFPRPFGFSLFVAAVNNTPLLVFGLINAYRLTRGSFPMRTIGHLTDFTLVLWVIASFASAGLRGGGYEHYALVVVPPLVLMGANEISRAYQHWEITSSKKKALLGAGIMTILVAVNIFWMNFYLYRNYISRISGEGPANQYRPDGQQKLAEYIQSRTTPEDFVYVWSNNVMLYYSADRLPPIDFLWPSDALIIESPDRIFDPRTKYIIADDADLLPRPPWLSDGLEQYYLLETVIAQKEIYRRSAFE